MKIGDAVVCNCKSETWYKGVPGIVIENTRFSTKVLVNGEVIELSPASLEVINAAS